MKILLADDDSDLIGVMSYVLLRQGHRVIAASDGGQAWQRWLAEQPDLALLDITMPVVDGLDLCRRIRQTSVAPVILLTALGSEEDLVRGYECGADDYIVKPFSPRHLMLRIDAVMRRVNGATNGGNGRPSSRVDICDLLIDPAAYEVRKNNTRIPLTRLEFRILYYLAQAAGSLVEASRLAEYAWQSPEGGDASLLKTHVSHIRQKLADAGGDLVHIRAIPRTGYILSTEKDEDGKATDDAPSIVGAGAASFAMHPSSLHEAATD